MKALAFPWFEVKVRPLCTRGSLKAVEAGKPDRALMVRQVWAGDCVRGRRGILPTLFYAVVSQRLVDQLLQRRNAMFL